MELSTSDIYKKHFKLLIFFIILKASSLQKTTINVKQNSETSVKTSASSLETTTVKTIFTTINIASSTCKTNDSCQFNNHSSETNHTTISPVNQTTLFAATLNSNNETTTAPTESSSFEKKQKAHASVSSSKDICICDLKVNYCDLNCCCDEDCSSDDKMVFGHCEEDFHYYDTRLCEFVKHIYINNTPQEWQIHQSGLFCVVRNNLPPSYIIQQKYPLKSLRDIEFQKINKYSWPEIKEIATVTSFSSHNYSYGKPVWVIQNDAISTFQIPKAFITSNCLMKEDIKYLIDAKNRCSHKEIRTENNQFKPETYFVNLSIIAKPDLFNVSLYEKKNNFKGCPKNVCLVVEPKICNEYFESCLKISKNATELQTSCRLSIANNTHSCYNLVHQIKYVFYHNGTSGISKVDLFLILKNVTYFYGEDVNFFQNFEVYFLWSNHSLNYSSYLSGNPGYLIGKPVLTANIISRNITFPNNTNSSVNNNANYSNELMLFRNPFDFSDNFIILPDNNNNGDCILSRNRYIPVEFGFNVYSKCTIHESLLNNKNISATNVCIAIQKVIFRYWSLMNVTNSTLNNKLIGQYGSANIYDKNEWLKIMFKEDLQEILNKTWGKFDPTKQTVHCVNITTLLSIEIFHSRVDLENILNQEKILATTFRFGNLKNISFPLMSKEKYFNFSIQMRTQVMFFDITTKKIRKSVDPPSLSIRLPYDFFYPFVKINNNTVKQTFFAHIFLINFIIVLIF